MKLPPKTCLLSYHLCTLTCKIFFYSLLFVFYLLSLLSFLMQLSRCSASLKKGELAPLGAGGDNEIRTRDLLLARQALSQLSYAPVGVRERALKIEQ